jgi:hypothetical protein
MQDEGKHLAGFQVQHAREKCHVHVELGNQIRVLIVPLLSHLLTPAMTSPPLPLPIRYLRTPSPTTRTRRTTMTTGTAGAKVRPHFMFFFVLC